MDPMDAAAQALGEKRSGIRLVRSGPGKSVWRAQGGGSRCFVRRHLSRRKFDQEVAALGEWAPRLKGAPGLLLAEWAEPHGLIAVTALPGEAMALTPFSLETRLATPRRLAAAGALLRDLHDLPLRTLDPVPLSEALTARARAWALRAAPHVGAPAIRRAEELVQTATRSEELTRVPCHRDFGPHNWLVDGDALGVIDWEHARPDSPFADLERATELLDQASTAAFLRGYGADAALTESPHFRAQVVLAALARIAWAVPRGDRAFEVSGRERLAAALA